MPVYKNKIKNRIKTLLIPYIAWNLFFVLYILLKFIPPLNYLFPNFHQMNINFTLNSILSIFWDNFYPIIGKEVNVDATPLSPLNFPLWFLGILFFISLITPIIFILNKRVKVLYIIILGCLWVSSIISNHFLNELITGLLFFSLGAYLSIWKKDLISEINKYKYISIGLFSLNIIILFTFPEHNIYELIKRVNTFVGIFVIYYLTSKIVQKYEIRVSNNMTNISFFIYISHAIFYRDIIKLTYKLLPPYSDLHFCIDLFLSFILIILTCTSLYYLISKITPKFLKLTTGKH